MVEFGYSSASISGVRSTLGRRLGPAAGGRATGLDGTTAGDLEPEGRVSALLPSVSNAGPSTFAFVDVASELFFFFSIG